MNCNIKGKRIFVSAIFLSLLLGSCKKEDSDIGLGLENELLNATMVDSFQINTYTIREDSLKTDELTTMLLGSYVDPVFGKTSSTIYTQFRPASPNPSVDMGITTVDSVRLYFRYSGYYGELDPQTFTVQRITERFYKDSAYYSDRSMTTDGIERMLSGSETVRPNYTANVVVGNDTLAPMLSLKLDNAMGLDILNAIAAGHLVSEATFNNYFYGLRIGVNNVSQPVNSGGILYLDPLHAQTKMVVYYTEGTVRKELAFPIGTSQARFEQFVHDYTGTPVGAQLSNPALGQKAFYTQSMAGVTTIMTIPGLSNLKNFGTNVLINKAELYLPAQYFIGDVYGPAPSNFLSFKLSNGKYSVTVDQGLLDPSYGGTYVDSKKAVTFNIGRHVQYILRGDLQNLGFKLANIGSGVTATRNVYNGQQTTNREKPYLKVYYTKY